MMNEQDRKDLLSMGYRQVSADPEQWAKPVGYNLFIFEEDNHRWTQWFVGANDEKLIWNSFPLTEDTGDTLADRLAFVEYTSNCSAGKSVPFPFLTKAEQAELMLSLGYKGPTPSVNAEEIPHEHRTRNHVRLGSPDGRIARRRS